MARVGAAGEPESVTVAEAVGVAGLVCAGEPAVGAAPSPPQPGSADNVKTAASIAADRILLGTAWFITLETYHSKVFAANGRAGAAATRQFGIIRKSLDTMVTVPERAGKRDQDYGNDRMRLENKVALIRSELVIEGGGTAQ